MKIRKVEAKPFCLPIKKFTDAYTGFTTSNAVLIKMHTDEGSRGLEKPAPGNRNFMENF